MNKIEKYENLKDVIENIKKEKIAITNFNEKEETLNNELKEIKEEILNVGEDSVQKTELSQRKDEISKKLENLEKARFTLRQNVGKEIKMMEDKLKYHDSYIKEFGIDMEEIRDFKWE